MTTPQTYTCPFPGCGATSSNPDDVAQQFCGRCGRFFRDPLGLECPGCGQHAIFQITGQQAFCGNDDCQVLAWEPAKDALQLVNRTTVDLVRKDIL